MPPLTPERYAQLVDELNRCSRYFDRLNTELDATGTLRTSTLIYWVKHYIASLQHELENNQAEPPQQYGPQPRRRGR